MANEVQTVGEAVQAYLDELKSRGTTKAHQVSVAARLKLMMPNQDEQLLTELHPIVCQRLYDEARNKGKSVDYHRNALLTARSMCTWLVETGALTNNPFAGIKGVGKRKRGKVQLTIDESRKFVDTCLAEDSTNATAALCCLLLAMRAGEICGLTPRAIDDGGRILRVERSTTKTEAGERLIEVPDVLRSRMPALAAAEMTRHRINHHVRRLCRLAGVTEVGPHALRGTHASLATRAGATSQLVASTLGHAKTSVTEAHYTERGATEAQAGAVALKVLNGGRS
jgi:integrase